MEPVFEDLGSDNLLNRLQMSLLVLLPSFEIPLLQPLLEFRRSRSHTLSILSSFLQRTGEGTQLWLLARSGAARRGQGLRLGGWGSTPPVLGPRLGRTRDAETLGRKSPAEDSTWAAVAHVERAVGRAGASTASVLTCPRPWELRWCGRGNFRGIGQGTPRRPDGRRRGRRGEGSGQGRELN